MEARDESVNGLLGLVAGFRGSSNGAGSDLRSYTPPEDAERSEESATVGSDAENLYKQRLIEKFHSLQDEALYWERKVPQSTLMISV